VSRDEFNQPAIIGEAGAGQEAARSAEVLKKLESLTKGIEKETFDIAEPLAEVREQRYFELWNYETFWAYAAAALGIGKRQAQYLLRIVAVSEIMGIPRAKYENLGISKVKEIFSLDPHGFFTNHAAATNEPLHEHIAKLLDSASAMSFEDIKAEVARLKGMDKENSLVWIRTKMTKSAKENVYDKAVELARAQLGSAGRDEEGTAVEYSEGAALEVICSDFLSDPNNQPEETESGD